MNNPKIYIELDRRTAQYEPGEVLVGQYRVDIDPDLPVRAVECSVIWTTSGIGDEDVGVHFFERRAKSTLATSLLKQDHRISTVLPMSPLSYAGKIVQVSWRMRVRVFINNSQHIEDCEFCIGNAAQLDFEPLNG